MRQRRVQLEEHERSLIETMAGYPLEPGQMLLLGPLSVAYLSGDYRKAPWLFPGIAPPNNKRLPDKHVLSKKEWKT